MFLFRGRSQRHIDKIASARNYIEKQRVRGTKHETQQRDNQLRADKLTCKMECGGVDKQVNDCYRFCHWPQHSAGSCSRSTSMAAMSIVWNNSPSALLGGSSPEEPPDTRYTAAIGQDGFNPAKHMMNGFDTRHTWKANVLTMWTMGLAVLAVFLRFPDV